MPRTSHSSPGDHLPDFATSLFEEAKRLLEKANEPTTAPSARQAYLHSSLLLGFASFEAHVNLIADDFLTRKEITPHERGLLAEQPVKLVHGEFVATKGLQMHKLEDRVLFLCRRFSGKPLNRDEPYWSAFCDSTKLRNRLTHPKSVVPRVDANGVTQALSAILELLNALYQSLYKRKYPAYGRGLVAKIVF